MESQTIYPFFMKFISSARIRKFNGEILGKGSFAKVVKAEIVSDSDDKLANNEEIVLKKGGMYAVKIVNDPTIRFILREGCLLNFVNHPFIMNLIACYFYTESNDFKVSFVTPIAGKKSLSEKIKEKKEFSPIEKNKIIYGICRGLLFLHHQKIYHRDMKSENILMMDDNLPKISDLGTSKIKEGDASESVVVRSTCFAAPEVLYRRGSFPSDVFSLALIIWEILEGKLVIKYFNNTVIEIQQKSKNMSKNINKFKKKIADHLYEKDENRPKFSEKTPKIWKDLIQRMWKAKAAVRPTMEKIIDEIEKPEYFLPGVDEDEMNKFISEIKKIESKTYYYVPNGKVKYIQKINSILPEDINKNDDDDIDEKQFDCLISRSPVNYLIDDFEENESIEKKDENEDAYIDDYYNEEDDNERDEKKDQEEYNLFYCSYLRFIYGLFNLADLDDSEAMISSAMFCMENICDYSIAYKILKKLETVNKKKAESLLFLIEQESKKSLFVKAMILEGQEKYQEAVDTYYQCIETERVDEKVLGHLGRLLAIFGETEEQKKEGIKLMENAATLNDQFSLYHLGVIYLGMSKNEEEEEEDDDDDDEYSKAIDYLKRADQFPDSYLQLYEYYCVKNPDVSKEQRIKYDNIVQMIFTELVYY